MKLRDLSAALSPMLGGGLADDLVRDFLKIRQDHATGTLERASPGKFVETTVQCLQHLARGSHDLKPDVDRFLREVEGDARIPEGLRVCVARIARAMYTLRNKRNVAHKAAAVDPNEMDLAFAHHASSWIMSEFLRNATSVSMDEAAALIALVQAPVGTLVEDIDGTLIVLADVSIRDELLLLLHSRYPERVSKGDVDKSLSRRNAGSVRKALSDLHHLKLAHGDAKNGYHLTQTGYAAAVAAIAELLRAQNG
jgi:hypothetical protein